MKKLSLLQMVCVVLVFCAATAISSLAQVLTTLHSFAGADGANPDGGLIQTTDGNFYGTSGGGAGTVFKITPSGTLATLYSFCSQSNCADGNWPRAGLTQATDGNLYGTTFYGGAYDNCSYGCGTVFKITPNGTLTTLHSFSGTDGAQPSAELIQAADGNFYGTTSYGGANGICYGSGCGTIFKITPSGALTTLHSFAGYPSDGGIPEAGLVQASDGNFYGTTFAGGAGGHCYNFPYGCGTVFKITRSGTLTTLYSFDYPDGAQPSAELIQAADGNFYGTTSYGGDDYCSPGNGCGTVFKITPSGALTTLHSFAGYPSDGAWPSAGLVQASDGNFYGTTFQGGAYCSPSYGCGTVFKITASGTLTTLHSFAGYPSDGDFPTAGLAQARDGNFYGTTGGGGAYCSPYGCGTVFRLVLPRKCIVCQSGE